MKLGKWQLPFISYVILSLSLRMFIYACACDRCVYNALILKCNVHSTIHLTHLFDTHITINWNTPSVQKWGQVGGADPNTV